MGFGHFVSDEAEVFVALACFSGLDKMVETKKFLMCYFFHLDLALMRTIEKNPTLIQANLLIILKEIPLKDRNAFIFLNTSVIHCLEPTSHIDTERVACI